METKIIKKVEGGKLLKIFLDIKNDKIQKVRITGDFFAHPEESIEILERKLEGKSCEDIRDLIKEFIDENKVKLYGIDAKSIEETIKEAWNGIPTT